MNKNLIIELIVVVVVIAIVFMLLNQPEPEIKPQITDAITDDTVNGQITDSVTQTDADTVTYTHPSGAGSTEQDCFDESGDVCLTRGTSKAVYNAGTASIRWGCGTCDTATTWVNAINQMKSSCFGGSMPNIVGAPVCLETPSGNWDVQYTEWQSGGGGGFAYTRTKA